MMPIPSRRLNYGSDIPKARTYLIYALTQCYMDAAARMYIMRALALMNRRRACRRSVEKGKRITAEQKRQVRMLKFKTDLSYQEIAIATGLTNTGRVSEIMNGLR
jgi:hypothetical protein